MRQESCHIIQTIPAQRRRPSRFLAMGIRSANQLALPQEKETVL
jgi:hypothetical protein